MNRFALLAFAVLVVVGCASHLRAYHPSPLYGDYTLEGPVWPVSEGYIFGHRLGGPVMVHGIASPDGSLSVMLGGYFDLTTTWEVIGFDTQTGEWSWNYRAGPGIARMGVFSRDSTAVYLAGNAGDAAKTVVLDSKNGEILWVDTSHSGRGTDIALTPDETRAFVVGEDRDEAGLLAVAYEAQTGEEIWSKKRGDVPEFARPSFVAASPSGSAVLIAGWDGEEQVLLALDADNGEELWVGTLDMVVGRMAIAPEPGILFLAGIRGKDTDSEEIIVAAYEPVDGELVWEASHRVEGMSSGYITGLATGVDGEQVYVTAGLEFDDEPTLPVALAFDAKSGDELWRTTGERSLRWRNSDGLTVQPDTGHVVTAELGFSHLIRVRAHEPGTGEEVWKVERPAGTSGVAPVFGLDATFGGVSVFGGRVGSGCRTMGDLTFFLSTTVPEAGEHHFSGPVENHWTAHWKRDRVSVERIEGSVLSPDAATVFIAGGTLKRNEEEFPLLAAFDVTNGDVRWSYEGEEPGLAGGVAVSEDGETVFIATAPDAHVLAFAADDGTFLWQQQVEHEAGSDIRPPRLAAAGSERVVVVIPVDDGSSEVALLDAQTGETIKRLRHGEKDGFARINAIHLQGNSLLYVMGSGRRSREGPLTYLATYYSFGSGSLARRRPHEHGPFDRDAEATDIVVVPNQGYFLTGLLPAGDSFEQIISTYGFAGWPPDWTLRLPRELKHKPALAGNRHRLFALGVNSATVEDGLAPQWIAIDAFDSDDGRQIWSTKIEADGRLQRPKALRLAPDGETLIAAYTRTALSTEVVIEGYRARTGDKMWSASYLSPLRGAARITDLHFGAEPGRLILVGEGRAGTGGPKVMALAYEFDDRAWGDRFDLWQAEHLPGENTRSIDMQPGGDLGGFGIPNLLRYALGLDARQPERSGLPRRGIITVAVDGEIERYLSLRYTKNAEAVDLEYNPEVSYDMKNWIRVPEANIMRRKENPDGTETITIADWVPVGDAETDRRFMRLRVERVE